MRTTKRFLRSALTAAGARHQHRREVARLTDAPWGDPAGMDAVRLRLLAETVRRAAATSPFYRQVLGSAPVVPRSFDELAALPVTSKIDMRDSGLDRARPRSVLRPRRVWRTSGSSGVPYEFAVDFWYPDRHRAQRAFVYRVAGVEHGQRVVEIIPGVERHDDARWSYPTFRRTGIGYKRDDVAEVVRQVRPRLLYGNRSHLLEVAARLQLDGIRCDIPYVCSSSETLHPVDEAQLERAFGCQVLEIYGSTEASNLAYRLAGHTSWTILEPRVVVEVLDAGRRPVAPGEVGELVVTTLTERTSPLIRYATGDLARVHSGSANGASGLRLAALEGRQADSLLDGSGRRVSFWGIATPSFWVAPHVARHVARWQIHQAGDRSVTVTIEPAAGGDPDVVRPVIVDHVRSHLGDVPVRVHTSTCIHQPGSGKFRPVTSDALVV